MKFEIKVPQNGKNPGTIGWLKDQLNHTTLEVGKNREGENVLIAVQEKNEKGEHYKDLGLSKPWRTVIAIISIPTHPEEFMGWFKWADNCFYTPIEIGDYSDWVPNVGYFGMPLTQSAYQKAKEFIENSVSEFYEGFKNDFQEEKMEVEF